MFSAFISPYELLSFSLYFGPNNFGNSLGTRLTRTQRWMRGQPSWENGVPGSWQRESGAKWEPGKPARCRATGVCVGGGSERGRAGELRVRSSGAGSRHAAASSTAEHSVCVSTPATRGSPGERRTSGLARRCLGNGNGVRLDFPSSVRIPTPISWSCLQSLPTGSQDRIEPCAGAGCTVVCPQSVCLCGRRAVIDGVRRDCALARGHHWGAGGKQGCRASVELHVPVHSHLGTGGDQASTSSVPAEVDY